MLSSLSPDDLGLIVNYLIGKDAVSFITIDKDTYAKVETVAVIERIRRREADHYVVHTATSLSDVEPIKVAQLTIIGVQNYGVITRRFPTIKRLRIIKKGHDWISSVDDVPIGHSALIELRVHFLIDCDTVTQIAKKLPMLRELEVHVRPIVYYTTDEIINSTVIEEDAANQLHQALTSLKHLSDLTLEWRARSYRSDEFKLKMDFTQYLLKALQTEGVMIQGNLKLMPLERLTCHHTIVTDSTGHLKDLTRLTHLQLGGVKLSSEFCDALSLMTALRSLSLKIVGNPKPREVKEFPLSTLSSLTILDLQFSGTPIVGLSQCYSTDLTRISISGGIFWSGTCLRTLPISVTSLSISQMREGVALIPVLPLPLVTNYRCKLSGTPSPRFGPFKTALWHVCHDNCGHLEGLKHLEMSLVYYDEEIARQSMIETF
jgi:hypothetical protein